ncbi:hypothetical protein DSL72_000535 [Monilinia vaccinii-corymbosi]|uniref:Uncharacterized protein n=1 Tax=Monilinia vaccinii-corymbosi TaxID=61207 RepID=A0A8A3NZ86_9HELO|nr:hypothetical protein DSL72_000535 [Monilinia vaccinii-corymbosi]
MQFYGLKALMLSLFVAFVCAYYDGPITTTRHSTSHHTRTISHPRGSNATSTRAYNQTSTVPAPTGTGCGVGNLYKTQTITPTVTPTTHRTGPAPTAQPTGDGPMVFLGAAPSVQAGSVCAMGLFAVAMAALL